MSQTLRIGIIGEWDATRPSHRATNEALGHAAAALALELDIRWLPTAALEGPGGAALLEPCHALWCAPGGPYESLPGALRGIRTARERGRPFLGT
jgi:CTP synthase (UTP-ammonia lyase)